MKWEKLGQIFDPTTYDDGIKRSWMKEFAQCPSAIVFDDWVRVYFSSRPMKDSDGQSTSYTGFLDLDRKDLKKILTVSKKPVLPLGKLGSFDEFAVYPTSVIKENSEYRLYYAGWNRMKSVPFNTSIGIALSNDGKKFNRIGNGPILTSSLYEPFVISGPKVRKFNNQWWMFYLAGSEWVNHNGRQEIIYKIKAAKSDNGIDWIKLNRNLILDSIDNLECQAGPDVFYYNGRYHMYFVYRNGVNFRDAPGRGYRIGYAYSKDLENWVRDDENVGIKYSEEGWDSSMHHYPHVFTLDNTFYMLYNGNEFGKYGIGLAKMID
jgi:predicted GH43/DUF377 family glycosyl hydrolase